MGSPTDQSGSTREPAVVKILPDGTVLYKTWQDAALARQQQNAHQQQSTVATQAQARLGQQYTATDGTQVPATLAGLVEFQATGLIVVLVVLAGLSLLCAVLGRLLRQQDRQPTVKAQPVAAAAPAEIHPGLTDQQLVVLLTAAASEMLQQPVRVEYFRQAPPGDPIWAAQGRSELVHSHRLK